MIQKGKQISIRRTDFERKVTNNYISALSRTYNPQPTDTKKINIDVTDMDDFTTLYTAMLKVAFGFNLSEARFIYAFLSIANDNYDFFTSEASFQTLATFAQTGIGSIKNSFYAMYRAGVFERIDESRYKLKDDYYMSFKDTNKRLIIDLNYTNE